MGGKNSGRPIGSYDKHKYFHECPVCKETFEGRAGAKYCSPSCNMKAYYRRKVEIQNNDNHSQGAVSNPQERRSTNGNELL